MRFLLVVAGFVVLIASDNKYDKAFDFEAFRSYYNLTDSITERRIQNKAVLIEFWATWCQPCRVKNFELNELYAKYNDKIELIGVALDTDSLRWRKAIRNDQLTWPIQVRDTAKWNSSFLKSAGISYLPNNVLVDINGKVLGRELSGAELQKLLNQQD